MLRSLFSRGPKVDIAALLKNGAMILDVRTPAEFAEGHVEGAVNIPLDQLQRNLSMVSRERPVITCCRSGARSGLAESLLRDHGYDAYNGGAWTNVERLLER